MAFGCTRLYQVNRENPVSVVPGLTQTTYHKTLEIRVSSRRQKWRMFSWDKLVLGRISPNLGLPLWPVRSVLSPQLEVEVDDVAFLHRGLTG